MPPDTFETTRLLLRPVTITDIDAIFEGYAQDEEVTRYLIWRPHRSRSETQAYVERSMATPSEVERTYMIAGRDGNASLRCSVSGRCAMSRTSVRPARWRSL